MGFSACIHLAQSLTDFLNPNNLGGWKAVACVGFAQKKGKHLT